MVGEIKWRVIVSYCSIIAQRSIAFYCVGNINNKANGSQPIYDQQSKRWVSIEGIYEGDK